MPDVHKLQNSAPEQTQGFATVGPVDQERVSGVTSPTSCDDETMAVALEALLIPTDVRDHSGRSGLSAFGLACLLRDARLHNPLPLPEFRDVQPNGRQHHLRQHL